jgi:polysaccharide deacetylase 2 family uncharacterized protein YibQ
MCSRMDGEAQLQRGTVLANAEQTRHGLEGQMGALEQLARRHGTSKSGSVLMGTERKGTAEWCFRADSVSSQ